MESIGLLQTFSIFTSNLTGNGNFGVSNSTPEQLELGFGLPNDADTRRVIHYSTAILLTVVGILGVIGNGLVLYVFTRYQRLRTGGGPLILSLAASDLMVSILHILPAYSSFMETWAFGKLGCELYAGATGLGGLASLITLSAIAADRFYVIFGRPIGCLARKGTCFCIWCLSLGLVLPPFFGWSEFCLEGMGTSCSWNYSSRTLSNRLYYIFLLTFGFVFPVAIIVISYIGILIVVCQHSRALRGFSRNGVVTRNVTPTDIRTTQVVLTLVLCFLISWTPYAVVSLIGQFGPPGALTQLGTTLPALFAKGSCIYNPIIYGLSHPHFRSAVLNIWNKSNPTLGQHLCYQTTPSNVQLHLIQNSRSYSIISKGQLRTTTAKRPSDGNTSTQTARLRSETAARLSFPRINCETPENGTPMRRSRQSLASTGNISYYCHHAEPRCTEIQRHRSKSELKSSYRTKFNYSAPDLRRNSKIVKNPNLLCLSEYRALRRRWLWKVLFRSETCLYELLQSDDYHELAKLANPEINSLLQHSKKEQRFRRHRGSPRHYPHPPVERSSITFHGSSSARSSISAVPSHSQFLSPGNAAGSCGFNSRRHTEPKIDEHESRKKSTTSILHKANHSSKRDSNLLALPLRFEDGIPSGEEETDQHTTPSPTRRSSAGRKSSSSGSKGSAGAVVGLGRKSILELFTGPNWMRRKSSYNSEVTGISHYTSSQHSGSQCKKFSFESSVSRHQLKYFLMHQRDCCECSFRLGSSCPGEQKRLFSFDNNS